MASSIQIPENSSKAEKYQILLPQIEALISGETNLISNLANIAAALKEAMGFFWVGFYLVEKNELVLGPFQGSVACTRIPKGKGVCGQAWENERTIIVEDVDLFPGHIACSSLSKSEIVIPLKKTGEIIGVLDVDSDSINSFDEVDNVWLSKVLELLA